MQYINNGLRVCWNFFKTVLWELLTGLISIIILSVLFTIKMLQHTRNPLFIYCIKLSFL